MDEDKMKVIIKQLLKCVKYMHSRGVTHRDIKLDNILINPNMNKIKLVDFGVSKKFLKTEKN